MEDFIEFRKNKRKASEEKRTVWPSELAETFRSVNKSREEMRIFSTKFKEYLRNKYSKDDESYKGDPEYQQGMQLIRKLERLEGTLFDLLYEIRKY